MRIVVFSVCRFIALLGAVHMTVTLAVAGNNLESFALLMNMPPSVAYKCHVEHIVEAAKKKYEKARQLVKKIELSVQNSDDGVINIAASCDDTCPMNQQK